jgi:1,4-dihydroxy-6-naphthoate synthase
MDHKRLKLAISPCPNDTFIFGAWINHLIDNNGIQFPDTDYLDIQDLNEKALKFEYDIIKISAALIPEIISNYEILACGGAFTEHEGPLLITKKRIPSDEFNDCKIVLPGKNTTAAFLFKYLFPKAGNISYLLFSEIEQAVLDEEFDAGVIIHESRFTYAQKGLSLLFDLGHEWNIRTGQPVPLGVIALKRELLNQKALIETQIRKSIAFARTHPDQLFPYIQSKSVEMDSDTIEKHISLYVNDYSVDMAQSGKEALNALFNLQALSLV